MHALHIMSYCVDNQAINKSKKKYEQTQYFLAGVCASGIYPYGGAGRKQWLIEIPS